MNQNDHDTLARLNRKARYAQKAKKRAEAERVTAHLIATTEVPYDPLGRRHFAELDADLKQSRRVS